MCVCVVCFYYICRFFIKYLFDIIMRFLGFLMLMRLHLRPNITIIGPLRVGSSSSSSSYHVSLISSPNFKTHHYHRYLDFLMKIIFNFVSLYQNRFENFSGIAPGSIFCPYQFLHLLSCVLPCLLFFSSLYYIF